MEEVRISSAFPAKTRCRSGRHRCRSPYQTAPRHGRYSGLPPAVPAFPFPVAQKGMRLWGSRRRVRSRFARDSLFKPEKSPATVAREHSRRGAARCQCGPDPDQGSGFVETARNRAQAALENISANLLKLPNESVFLMKVAKRSKLRTGPPGIAGGSSYAPVRLSCQQRPTRRMCDLTFAFLLPAACKQASRIW